MHFDDKITKKIAAADNAFFICHTIVQQSLWLLRAILLNNGNLNYLIHFLFLLKSSDDK